MNTLNKFCKVIKGKYSTEPAETTSSSSSKMKVECDDAESKPMQRSHELSSDKKSPKKMKTEAKTKECRLNTIIDLTREEPK